MKTVYRLNAWILTRPEAEEVSDRYSIYTIYETEDLVDAVDALKRCRISETRPEVYLEEYTNNGSTHLATKDESGFYCD